MQFVRTTAIHSMLNNIPADIKSRPEAFASGFAVCSFFAQKNTADMKPAVKNMGILRLENAKQSQDGEEITADCM